MQLSEAVDLVEWRCSRRVCKHQYILKKEQLELFQKLKWALRASPFSEKYLECNYKVCFIAGFKYWCMGDVINRKPMTEKETGKVTRKEHFLGEVKLGEEARD